MTISKTSEYRLFILNRIWSYESPLYLPENFIPYDYNYRVIAYVTWDVIIDESMRLTENGFVHYVMDNLRSLFICMSKMVFYSCF